MSRLTQLLIIAHASDADVQAKAVAKQMRALGYEVEHATSGPVTRPRASVDDRLAQAWRVVVLWSEEAARAPWLHAAARRAGKMGKLTVMRTAGLPAPAALRRASIELPRRRRNGVSKTSRPSQSSNRGRTLMNANSPSYRPSESESAQSSTVGRTSRINAVMLVVIMTLIGGGAAYQVDPAFATQVNAVTSGASAQASAFIGSFSH